MRHLLQPILLSLLLGALAAGAAAQGDEPAAAAASEVSRGASFADQFFIVRKTAASGEKSIEVLGSLIIWFLLVLSVLSLGLMGNMALGNQRASIVPPATVAEVRRLLAGGRYREAMELVGRDQSFFGQVLGAALREASHGYGAVIRSLDLASDELTTRRLRRIEYLNVLGQVSPMIGLFGTVYGMILAFQSIVAAGGNADPVLLAGGISTALTTTFWGLVVAIPALAGYAIIRNKIDELTTEATATAEDLLNQFRPRAPGKSGEPAKSKAKAALETEA